MAVQRSVLVARGAGHKRGGFSIVLHGGEQLSRILDKLGDSVERDVAIQIAHAAYEVQAQAISDAPYETGALKNSIEVRFYEGGQVATVSSKLPRAVPHEFSRKYGEPYLRPAFKEERPKLMAAIRGILRRDLAAAR